MLGNTTTIIRASSSGRRGDGLRVCRHIRWLCGLQFTELMNFPRQQHQLAARSAAERSGSPDRPFRVFGSADREPGRWDRLSVRSAMSMETLSGQRDLDEHVRGAYRWEYDPCGTQRCRS